ncbi:probable peptidoglycan muropeptide transporter SLC46 [Planococcus citri]|uniref:probable peptidoglycan muropeptide transporter SLC46 n=1 Tax=Planococcus citri TaxID=170843 RepID=UPI0031F897B3
MIKNIPSFVKNITIEPAFLLYTATYVIAELTGINLFIQKKCRVNITSEPDLSTPCDEEKQGIVFASEMITYLRFTMLFLCTLYGAIAMCWSDEAGRRRRPLIFLPIIGLILQSVCGCFHSYYWTWDPFYGALCNVICEVISGGIPLMTFASQAYVCDVSEVKSRTMRLGVFSAARTLGDLCGFGSAGFILRRFGFFYTHFICFVLCLVTLILAVSFVKDVSVQVEKKRHFWQQINFLQIFSSFKVVFKKSLGGKRYIVAMLLIIYIMVFFSTQGENSVQYLFLRYKFHWDERDYSSYVIYRYIGVILGSVFCSVVLSKLLKLHDGVIGTLAAFWDTLAAFGYLFASQNWHLYVVPLFDVFHGAVLSVSLSFFSKYYAPDELGRLICVVGVLGLVIPVCYPAYSTIFRETLDFFPSAYFVLSIAINIIVVFLYISTYFLSEKLNQHESTRNE